MLSDSLTMKGVPSPKVRTGKHYPDSDKIEAIKLWLVTGNLRAVSAALNIPYETLKLWRYSKWWESLADDIRTEGHIALSNRLKRIAEKAMDVTLDRLENGDFVYDQKTGQMVRKPVAMRDAHQVAISFQDRALKLEDKPQEEAAQQQVSDRLAALADAFSKMANKTKRIEVTDVSFKEHEESQPPQVGYLSQEADAEAGTEELDGFQDSDPADEAIEGTWREGAEEASGHSPDQNGSPEGRETDGQGPG